MTGDSSDALNEIRSEISHLNKRVDENERRGVLPQTTEALFAGNKLARARRVPFTGKRGIVSGSVNDPVGCLHLR